MTSETEIVYKSPTTKSWRDEGHFILPGVIYRGEPGTYTLFGQMTPAMTRENLAELCEQEKQRGNPHPTDMPLIWAIAARGHELRNKGENSEKLRQFLREGFRKCPNTLTGVLYSPLEDSVIHNKGTSDEYLAEGNIVGPDGLIGKIPDKDVLEKIIGTGEVETTNQVSQWINGTDTCIWRLNSRPTQRIERVAGFLAFCDKFVLGCYGSPLGEFPAFQILRVD